jgi:lipopolysaccharide export system protein LptA
MRGSALALAAALAVGTIFAAIEARAEKADRNKPVHVDADRATVDDAKQIVTLTGNVVITQGTTVLRGDKVEVRQDKDGFKSGTVWGNLAYFRQKRDGSDELIEGWSERIVYDSRAEKVEMFNRAMMKRGPDEVRGSYISYDITTEFYQVQGGATKSASARPGDSRVKMVLNPKPKEGATAPAPAPVPLRRDAGADVPRGEASAGK